MAPTVLVLAGERDVTADSMMRVLDRRGTSAVRVDTAWFPGALHLAARLDGGGRWAGVLDTGHRRVPLEGLRSVWYRSPGAFSIDPTMSGAEQHWAAGEARYGLGGVLAALPVRWVNHPSRLADAGYKPVQLATATRCGLRVPDTLITNDATAVRTFAERGEVVSKALGAPAVVEAGTRSVAFTRRLDAADLASLGGVEQTAHQFQRWIDKAHEVRLIAVGERLFAAEIHAGSPAARIDWRADYASLTYRAVDPPPAVAAGVAAYLHAMGLLFGAFDFVVTPDGDWVFLECNASGQYGWIESAIDAPITEALADLLTRPTC